MTAVSGSPGRRVATLVAAAGFVMVVGSLAGSFWPKLGGTPVPQRWSGETLYLRAEGRQSERCTVSPPAGPARTITVPGSPSRGGKLFGTRLEPWFDGTATIDCPSSVTATSGPILRVYPLAENEPWVILPGAVLLSAGWVYSRPRRPRRAQQ